MRGQRSSSPLGSRHLLVTGLLVLSLATRSVVRCLLLKDDLRRFVNTLEQYARTRNDIVFVLDESGSIGADNFPAERHFTEMTARLLTVSPDFSRLAVVTYGSNYKLHINYISDGGGSMCSFLYELEKIGYRGGSTMTRQALEYASSLLQNGRVGANRIIVLISDGQADSDNKPNDFARQLKRNGVIIFAVGVANINSAELQAVATSSAHIYMLTSFPYIAKVNRNLRKDIHESQWDQADQSQCLKVSGACDTNAICGCGARGGTHRCVCKAGYQGDGTFGKCQRCPRGSYKMKTGYENCDICPENSSTPDEGATSLNHCSCIPGYEGNPGGNVRCSPIKCAKLSDPPGGTTLPHPCGNTFGSECDFKCNEGHCPYLCNMTEVLAGNLPWNRKSGTSRVCQANKEWSGGQFFCDKVRCPALRAPPNGKLQCYSNTFEFGTTCVVTCSVGHNLVGNPNLTCSINGTWTGQLPRCDVVTCPPLKVNKKMRVDPSRCRNETSPYDFLCRYKCIPGWRLVDWETNTAADGARKCLEDGKWKDAGQKITCQDIEAPKVTSCPDDIIRFSATRAIKVTWEEPTFEDNAGNVTITSDRPQGFFSWGAPSTVNYTAMDAAGNSASCSFKVIVKPYKCPYVPPPRNGYLACDAYYQHCSVYCEDGYNFHTTPASIYRCKQIPLGWTISSRKKFPFPWPDCAASNRSEKANVIVKFKFETNACQISEEKMRALKEQFYARLRETTKHINGLCDPSRGCTMEKVSVKCRSKNFSSSTTTATNGQRPERRLTKRQAQGGDGEDEFELVISFDFPLGTGFNATQLIDGCEDCKNTSLVHPSDAETTALGRAIEAALSEVVGTTVDRTFPGASLVETTHAVKSACQRGQVSNGLRCVNCPVGTYYYETACVTCPIGTYSDKEAAESCVPCPDNKTTLEGKTASVSDCLALCAPGTWSRTGKEPCIACDPHSYQDQVGQLSCKKCTLGLSTGYWGAASSSECQALNYCSEMQPCANGSTCVDEATGFRCVCPEGLRGARCEQDVDDCEPGLCLNGGTCVDGFNAFSCLCPSGYRGAACEINVDDCASGPCFNGATCIDGIDAFACKCAKGFTGKLCDATFHDCTTKPCRNGGSCFESVTGFRCCCPKGFRGKTCELVEHVCLPNPCQNNGTCKKKSDSFQCACAPGFAGRRCERKVNNCASAPCLNGGTCVDGLASFSCRCHGLYTGDTCADVRSSQFTLHFRNASVLNYATVPVQRYLRAMTLSFHMKTTQTKERGTVFSYAFVDPRTKQVQDNAFTISDPNKLLLYVYGESYDTKVVANDGLWHHCAVTWESADGQWIFYWDEQEKARNFRAAGEVVFPGVLVVGQDQDRVGTAFSGVEAYSGHVAELNVWDYAMSPSEVRELSQACRLAGNVVSWPELRLAATNGIVIDDDWELCKGQCASSSR
ncbi:hypothetical protein HPB49_001344 [Dermacentor silvarum]|uniref:Uncharacterized protein n=1 Tax=Dermacentor silvarum TaxID=543639 RepID=A0ACB8CUI4_DERSI|nr:hypothetical protein HPB49_001344 [Dermacentor silvarum]